jgi:hypothetical protein
VQNLFSSSLLSKNVKIKIYRTIILPVVLHGCESWSLTLRYKVTREWRRLHNKELYALYSSPDTIQVIKKIEMGRTCSTYGERRGAYRVLVGKCERRRPLERPRCRGEDNSKMDL